MRLFCHICGKVTQHSAATSSNSIACEKCDRQQPIKSLKNKNMPPRKSSNSNGSSGSSSESSSIVPVNRSSGSGSSSVELTIPQFEPNSLMPANLFADSSPIPRTDQKTANEALISIKEKASSVQIAHENIKLARGVVQAGTEHVKLQGDVINYASAQEHNVGLGVDLEIERIGTQGKQVKHQIAGIGLNILQNKLGEEQEKLTQSNYSLKAARQATPLIQQEFQARIELQKTKVEVLKNTALQARSQFESQLEKLVS